MALPSTQKDHLRLLQLMKQNFVLSADDFNELRSKIPEFDEALKNLAAERIKKY